MKNDPITGPVPRDKFREIVQLPHGDAKLAIQEFDPLWGRAPGEKIEFQLIIKARCEGYATVMAASEEEAEKMLDHIDDGKIEWECDASFWDSYELVPVKKKTLRLKEPPA